jgi:pimeloyl-ACP methyl ester carboxylesterase
MMEMEVMMFLSFLLWAAPLAGGFYLVLRFIRAFERRGAGRDELGDLGQHVQALEESLDRSGSPVARWFPDAAAGELIPRLGTLAVVSAAVLTACQPALRMTSRSSPPPAVATFVLVDGAWGGSWSFQQLDRLLRAQGHEVLRPSLTGLGERAHLAHAEIGLGTHVQDVTNAILFEDLRNIVLVGHSYGGIVIAAVADSIPERIAQLIYLDAFLPEDGESVLGLSRGTPLEALMERSVAGAQEGLMIPPWLSDNEPLPHDVPQPVRTFTDPVRLRNAAAAEISGAYILTTEGPAQEDAFQSFAGRARQRGWPVLELEANHVPQLSAPDRLARLLLEIVQP